MARWLGVVAAVLAAGAMLGAAPRPAKPREAITAYLHVNIVDPSFAQGRVLRDWTVYVNGERIAGIMPSADVKRVPPGARLVDMKGAYLIPGLIDAHVHHTVRPDRRFAEAQLRRDVYGGITAVRDMGGDARILGPLAKDSREGRIAAPDVVFAAFMAGRSFFDADGERPNQMSGGIPMGAAAWNRAIGPGDDLAAAVREAKATGASGVKVYANLAPRQVAGLVAAAHAQGMQAWLHGMVFPTTPAEGLEAKPDGISHACYLAYQAMETRPARYHDRGDFPVPERVADTPAHPALAALFSRMKRDGVVLDPTIYVYGLVERMRAAIPEGQFRPPIYCSSKTAIRLTALAHRAGVAIAAGTDAPAEPRERFPSLIDEVETLAGPAGMGPLEALRAATANGARALGLEAEMGDIRYRRLANLVFLRENPLKDIRALRSVTLTVKRGREYWRRDYRQPRPEDLDRTL